ncbi:hypothetical protein LSTR_LSTR016137 [Laodelphax striatellus]|uniref:Uncharacterized protein n=1 Tax=Laodelphax striatellus TaxID=195883 RepID=A0A482WI81_LAOST|nr:hypothetical protein LSTR_LSTR016137 [Laodelphax striatellus]
MVRGQSGPEQSTNQRPINDSRGKAGLACDWRSTRHCRALPLVHHDFLDPILDLLLQFSCNMLTGSN